MQHMTVHDMVRQVIDNSRAQLAKTASAAPTKVARAPKPTAETVKEASAKDRFEKLAAACDFLADNIHLVADNRSPQEKLAEFAAVHDALFKGAEEIPMNPPLDSGVNPGGPQSALQAEETDTPGTSLEAGQSGEATPGHQTPKAVEPKEKANPADAPNALETNKEMMMPEQPEDVLKQAEAISVMSKLVKGGKLSKEAAVKALQKKAAEDTTISVQAGTNPDLQSVPGVPSQLPQGSEAGELTPREAAPNTGEGAGRQLVQSNEAAMNATKGQAKAQNRGALSEVLTEPAMSAAHDSVLKTQLQNESEAGTKLAAQKALLKKLAASSPQLRTKISALAKQAQGVSLTPDEEASVAPGARPVTPEEALAAQVLADKMSGEQAQEEEGAAAPGEEVPEKESQMGMTPMAPPPPTTPTM